MRTSHPPTYVYKNGFGNYYFRIAVPRKLRNTVNKYEIRRTLKTRDYGIAVKRARRLAVIAETLFKKDSVNEKELRDFLLTSSQIKMDGPIKIGRGILECGGIETDPSKPDEELKALSELLEKVESTGAAASKIDLLKPLVDQLLQSNPSSSEMLEAIKKLAEIIGGTDSSLVTTQNQSVKKKHFDELIEKYAQFQMDEGNWTNKTKGENLAIYEVLKDYFQDTPVDEISIEDGDSFRGCLLKLPPNVKKNPLYREKTVSQVINMKPEKTMAAESVNKYMRRCSAMFSWAMDREYTTRNPFKKNKIKSSKKANEKRDILSNEDLAVIFSPDNFYQEVDCAHKYFIPLVLLLSGCRLEECASLKSEKIFQVDDLWCFEFMTLKQKEYKTRIVPINQRLIELGILVYASKQKDRLFPELDARRDGFGEEVSRWYAKYRRKCGFTELRNKDLHSYRHTFSTALDKSGVESKIISQLIGHSTEGPGRSTTEKVYIKDKNLSELALAIDKLDYGEAVNNLLPYDSVIAEKL